jgi:hypothetical protein
VPGNETAYWHTCILLSFKHGVELVLGLAGYQFGHEKCLYTLPGFEKEMFGGEKEDGVEINVGVEIKNVAAIASVDEWAVVEENGEQRGMPVGEHAKSRATELLNLSLDDSFMYK